MTRSSDSSRHATGVSRHPSRAALRPSQAALLAAVLLLAGTQQVHADTETQAPDPTRHDNHPPRIETILPEKYASGPIAVKTGQEVQITLVLADDDGDALSLIPAPLPQGARFSVDPPTFTWRPNDTQTGQHVVQFKVSDGLREARRLVTFDVKLDRPPPIAISNLDFIAGQSMTRSLQTFDPEGDTVRYAIKDLPDGASFDTSSAELHWLPSNDDIGSHTITLIAADTAQETRQEIRIDVHRPIAEEEWESFFLPGANYAVFAPRANSELGVLQGVAAEIVLGAWIHRNENRGPSHGRAYAYTELLQSTNAAVPLTLGYGLGFSLSLERNPQRRWLVPLYGIDLGGLRQDDSVARFHMTPFLGVHLWSSQNVFLNARAGYRIVPSSLEQWGGAYASLGGDFTVW